MIIIAHNNLSTAWVRTYCTISFHLCFSSSWANYQDSSEKYYFKNH